MSDIVPNKLESPKPVYGVKTPSQKRQDHIDLLEKQKKKKFKDTAFGRTLTGKNTSGKILYGVAGVAVGATTGINIDPILQTLNTTPMEFSDLSLIQLAAMAITGLIGFLVSRELVKGLLQEILAEVQDIVNVTAKAKEADSPGGEHITEEEKKLIRKEMDDLVIVLYRRLVRSRLARLFGIHKGIQNPEE